MSEIKKIRMLASVHAKGMALTEGKGYVVPKDLSLATAEELVRMGRAEVVDAKRGASE